MKTSKKILAFFMSLVIVVSFSVFGTVQSYAHSAMLNVNYDNCEMADGSDGINEMWYSLTRASLCHHIPEDVYTIKYYIVESAPNAYTWTTDVTIDEAREIKNAYVNSMKKWNNVYFYSYNSSGIVEKRSLINITEGTASDHNLSIYPMPLGGESNPDNDIATTAPVGNATIIEPGTTEHKHYNEWRMNVCVLYFAYGNPLVRCVDFIRERVGAHELGHVLGLRDVDAEGVCNAENPNNTEHHHEILMGYGTPLAAGSKDIKYKDIAGVAITRGFHTDEDHMWLNAGVQSDGQYKLICSICNGVKMVSSLSGYSYSTYGSCGNAHTVASGNMIAVASYGNQDYYKCRYCRYVAPFDDIITQQYNKTNFDRQKHRCVNTVAGLAYTFYEAHVNESYITYDDTYHYTGCACGHIASKQKHLVQPTGPRYGICMVCNNEVPIGNGTISPWCNGGANVDGIFGFEGQILTGNGSYMLPNGVIVLVPADVDAYLKGELILPEDFSEYPTE